MRMALHDDVPALLPLCEAMHAEAPRYRNIPFDLRRTENYLHSLIEAPAMGGILLATRARVTTIGMFAFRVMEYPFSYEKFAADAGIYLLPECRGSLLFGRMVAAFEHMARAKGARDCNIDLTCGVHSEQTAAALERVFGYARSAVGLTKELKHV